MAEIDQTHWYALFKMGGEFYSGYIPNDVSDRMMLVTDFECQQASAWGKIAMADAIGLAVSSNRKPDIFAMTVNGRHIDFVIVLVW